LTDTARRHQAPPRDDSRRRSGRPSSSKRELPALRQWLPVPWAPWNSRLGRTPQIRSYTWNFRSGSIWPAHHAIGKCPLFAQSGRLESTWSGHCYEGGGRRTERADDPLLERIAASLCPLNTPNA